MARIARTGWGMGLVSIIALMGCTPDQAPPADGATNAAAPALAPAASEEQLQAMRDQFARIDMATDLSFLTAEEKRVLAHLIGAANEMSAIYLLQVDERNPTWRSEIAGRPAGTQRDLLLDLFDLHFGPWDTLDDFEPFYGDTERPLGAGFYPPDMTKAEFEQWIADHPEDEDAFRSWYTVIRRDENGGLIAIPYSVHYRPQLEAAAEELRAAAALTSDETLARFLTLRADAFLSDDYFESEMAWMDLGGRIEIAIGPYETYTDRLFGTKTAFEAFVAVKDPEQSAALDKYKGLLRDMEANLPVAEEYKNFKRGFASPISVVTQIHGGGDNVPGAQTIAFNLPNDERVREAKGAKKVILDNVLGAKFDRILSAMADDVLVPAQADLPLRKYMGLSTLFHELSHSLGPGAIVVDGEETTVSAQLEELYSAMEEGKADVMGAYNVLYMMERGELPAAERDAFLATYFTGLFRSMRFGTSEAHGRGAAFQYAFFAEEGVFSLDEEGRYEIDFDRLAAAIRDLTAQVVEIQGDGDFDAASAFLTEYGRLDAAAEAAIARLTHLPVDIEPVYPEAL